ncbi:hypothetical protein ATANTOWER_019592 [Ataeniobius toweri]|uniref:Uncharacterized protein n=1 Tax=Ataeniobius toweri TaxID=208326 RepID=A0ABU7BGJ7_9TELE|nr:hypothetical protein [Ataeniobius toweri]
MVYAWGWWFFSMSLWTYGRMCGVAVRAWLGGNCGLAWLYRFCLAGLDVGGVDGGVHVPMLAGGLCIYVGEPAVLGRVWLIGRLGVGVGRVLLLHWPGCGALFALLRGFGGG